ncbi:MAG: hypothetical protein QOD75_1439 [Blastocatellia bacterium]|jgi:hypothetical protein|nr:hypothetical protein [Blastocatellia bacterium]
MSTSQRFPIEEKAYTADPDNKGKREERRRSIFVDRLLNDELVLSPIPPGARGKNPILKNPVVDVPVDITDETEKNMLKALDAGALSPSTIPMILREVALQNRGEIPAREATITHSEDVIGLESALGQLGMCAIRAARATHDALLKAPSPFMEFRIRLSDRAKVALALGWEAIARSGKYPLPPYGLRRLQKVDSAPAGAFHFVSASDSDAGYFYTMGIALSPEAQALKTTNVSFGLDGELIVPGQAVSPIPPLLSLASRLFASGIMSSSNISEEQHSIPIRAFPQPDNYTDLKPVRPGLTPMAPAKGDLSIAVPAIVLQLQRNGGRYQIDAVIDISGLDPKVAGEFARNVLKSPEVLKAHETSLPTLPPDKQKPLEQRLALFYNVDRTLDEKARTIAMRGAIDLGAELSLKYLAVIDDVEDTWMPGIHEYFDYAEMNDLTRYADEKGVIIIDARPVDPMYTSSTALQRIQSVMTTLSVDILKMGMWLTLDATTAEAVWNQIQTNPAISRGMCLMPIGIVEPWSAFVDNRDPNRNARAIITPFSKIKFMIAEAKRLGMHSLLTDTRHKQNWVLLGARDNDFPPHPREGNGVTSLLSWHEFMECERLARDASILLGQAGSIEVSQIFQIISGTTYDAAQDGLNPATAFWTAETERVLRSEHAIKSDENLQEQRSASVDPYLAVVNRIYESHAKVDGWLQFLADRSQEGGKDGEALLQLKVRLLELKKSAEAAQDKTLQSLAQKNNDAAVSAWTECRDAYANYHAAVRDEFGRIRQLVSDEWARMGGKKTVTARK